MQRHSARGQIAGAMNCGFLRGARETRLVRPC